MTMQVLLIEDTSDCTACTRRHRDEYQMLQEVSCKLLEGITCPECGRTISIFVAYDSADLPSEGSA